MRTLIAVCLDESGSMDEGNKRASAISAFNEYLNEQKRLKTDECLFTLTKFNTHATTAVALRNISEASPLSNETYRPAGGTALLDAVAKVIRGLDYEIRETRDNPGKDKFCSHCGSEKKVKSTDRAIVVVLTDGEENSSRETTLEQLKGMIKNREERGNWSFVFLSAGVDKFAGEKMGFSLSSTAYFVNDGANWSKGIQNLNSATTAFRNSNMTKTSSYFTAEQKADIEADANQTVSSSNKP
jgi:hypothetical protein